MQELSMSATIQYLLETGSGASSANGLPKTGITTSIITGDDGDTERGFADTDLTDNDNNTISSAATGLQWVKEPQKIGALSAEGQWDLTHVRTDLEVGYDLGDLVKNSLYSGSFIGYPSWYSGTTYVTDDSAVQDFGTRYQCKLGHIADDYQPTVSSIYTDAWTQIADWQGGYYSPSTYTTSSYVNNGTDVYHCILGHVSDTYQPMGSVNWEDKWTEYAQYWDTATPYTTSSYVTNYNTGTPYKCILAHTSDASTEPGSGVDWATYWEVFSNTWTEDTAYTAGDMVVLYVAFYRFFSCDVTHRSSSKAPETSSDWATYWEKVTSSAWAPNETYTTSSYVSYSGMGTSFWKCKLGHVSSTKEPGVATGWQTYWDAIEVTMPGWLTDTAYTVGDKVYKFNGQITQAFECKANHTSTQSAFEPMSAELWSEKWTWIPDYYTCKLAHLSSVDTEPGVGSESATNWDLAYFTGSAADLTTPGLMDWQGAIQACEALELAGNTDWHLPNIVELLSIVDYSATAPTINATMFPNTQTMSDYITSSKVSNTLYSVSFNSGLGSTMNSMSAWGYYVRPVRKEV